MINKIVNKLKSICKNQRRITPANSYRRNASFLFEMKWKEVIKKDTGDLSAIRAHHVIPNCKLF